MRWLAFSIVLFGCSSTTSAPEPPAADAGATSFLAFERDFQGFRVWEKFSFAETSDAFPAHLGGPRDVYLNKRPPKGSKEFPVGTIIVKEVIDGGPFTDRIIFARVKRGSAFNPDGNGWEWFQLKNRADSSTAIVWRGLGPPDGDPEAGLPGYLGNADGCTPCHKGAANNDLVLAPPLQLSSL
ncbi:MAG: hypothetical protein ACXWUG_26300 [Polyangiales bacterium]